MNNARHHQQHHQQQPFTPTPATKLTQLTKFALLLSSALPENATTPVIGLNHENQLANCFAPQGIISCSSLSMHGHNSAGEGSSAALQERLAILNMNSPIYTSSSPDCVSSTPKKLLTHVVQAMNELMESRLARIIEQLLRSASDGAGGNSRVMVHLLSPSRNAIKICTVVTRFEVCSFDREADAPRSDRDDEMVTKMMFKAVLDVKIFGEVNTVELHAPVSFTGKFDQSAVMTAGGVERKEGPLLSSVDIKLDCPALLNEMISQGRSLVKKAVTEAASLSLKILSISENAATVSEAGGSTDTVNKLGASISGSSGSNSDLVAAALKLGTLPPGQSSLGKTSGLGIGAAPAPHQDLASTSSLAQLCSLLKSSSSNRLDGGQLSSSSKLSFDSFPGSFGSLRKNDTFASLLKSVNSLNNLGGANAEWGLKQSGDSAAILSRHLQNLAGARGSGGSGNANATFDLGNAANGGANAQAHNLLLGLAKAGGTGGGLAARISNGSIEGMKNVRFQDSTPRSFSNQAASLPVAMTQDHTLKQQMLVKLGGVLKTNGASAGMASSSTSKSQYDLLRDMLLKKTDASGQPSQSPAVAAAASQLSNESPQPEQESASNTYKGLFSWLENDSMFLSEDKLKEQDRIHKKKEQESRKAPMPMRFFSSGDDGNLEMMSESLFGNNKRKSNGSQSQKKKKGKTDKA